MQVGVTVGSQHVNCSPIVYSAQEYDSRIGVGYLENLFSVPWTGKLAGDKQEPVCAEPPKRASSHVHQILRLEPGHHKVVAIWAQGSHRRQCWDYCPEIC